MHTVNPLSATTHPVVNIASLTSELLANAAHRAALQARIAQLATAGNIPLAVLADAARSQEVAARTTADALRMAADALGRFAHR